MIKILFFIDRYYPTDHSFIEEIYTKILPQRGFDVTLVARSKDHRRITQTVWNSAKVILLPSKRKYFSDVLNVRPVRRLLKGDFDIVQVRNDPFFAMLCRHETFVFQMSHLKAEEMIAGWKGNLYALIKGVVDRVLRHIYLKDAKRIWVVSRRMKAYLKKKYRTGPVRVVPLGVTDVKTRPSDIDTIRSRYGFENHVVLIYIGTMARSRKLEVVLDAFRMANRSGRLALILLGDAPDKNDVAVLKQKVADEKIDHVVFVDRVPRNQVPDYIRSADIGLAVIPDNVVYRQSCPLKTIEYLIAGLPVLITPIPDQLELVERSGSGLVCTFDKQDIAEKMNALAALKNRRQMGRSGSAYVYRTRHYTKITENIVDCYHQILKRDSTPGTRHRIRNRM